MYACRGCGGTLKFDIASQQLKCESCSNEYNPYDMEQATEAEQDDYDVTVFKCPQCGGEIYSTDNTAAGFCSFCGASTVLTGRLKKEKRVNYIIPFKQTKEDCKKAYKKLMRHAIFAPKELKDEKNIDGFRGIYMPYWVYYVKQQGHVRIHGTKSHRSGDYIITRHYGLHMDLDAHYKGLSYDASSSFADTISKKLAPYNVKNMKAFTPSYLSGFYADMSDVPPQIYGEEAKEFAADETIHFVKNSREAKGYSLDSTDKLRRMLPTNVEQTNSAMFPVWFLSYQNKGRVAYATVNGQTGKVVADLPVDIKKYLFGSLILAIPIILLLNAMLTLRPSVVLSMVSVLAAIVVCVHASEMKQIAVAENYEDDIGAQIGMENKQKMEQAAREQAAREMAGDLEDLVDTPYVVTEANTKKNKTAKGRKNVGGMIGVTIFMIPIFSMLIWPVLAGFLRGSESCVLALIALIIAIIGTSSSVSHAKRITAVRNMGTAGALAAVILAFMILFWNPVSDLWYYGGVIAALLTVGFTLMDLIRSYNVLATRRLPQFDYRGGDDLA
ncbi:MAG: hypothetical protein K2G89_08105 [Lachnospiraceae bacterium]|nr:hypothetical protein [Lachnospiraceae bacterium]